MVSYIFLNPTNMQKCADEITVDQKYLLFMRLLRLLYLSSVLFSSKLPTKTKWKPFLDEAYRGKGNDFSCKSRILSCYVWKFALCIFRFASWSFLHIDRHRLENYDRMACWERGLQADQVHPDVCCVRLQLCVGGVDYRSSGGDSKATESTNEE